MAPAQNRRSSRIREWARRSGPAIYNAIQNAVILIGLLVVVILQLPWLQDTLKQLGLIDRTSPTLAIFTIVLVALYYEVKGITPPPAHIDRHFHDPMDVYPVLHQRVRETRRSDEKVLDVLGMSLYTAWPTIGFWLARPEMNGWTVRLAATVNHNDSHSGAALIPEKWFNESAANLDSIVEAGKSSELRRRNIKLEAYGYDFVPALHGFRLGNGDIFYSILHWQSDGKIGREKYSYEYVSFEDHSATAEAARELFDSWFERARRTPWSVP